MKAMFCLAVLLVCVVPAGASPLFSPAKCRCETMPNRWPGVVLIYKSSRGDSTFKLFRVGKPEDFGPELPQWQRQMVEAVRGCGTLLKHLETMRVCNNIERPIDDNPVPR